MAPGAPGGDVAGNLARVRQRMTAAGGQTGREAPPVTLGGGGKNNGGPAVG